MATPYKINIPLYEGPLDLLLDLIKKQEMNIHDIQIAKITSQYLDYLHKLEELKVDVSADFIYMAATLIYIKSKMLLPPDLLGSPEEQGADPRADLVQRLVEHEKFKNAAQLLYQKQQIEENVWSKPDKSLYHDEGTEGELVVSMVDLVRVFQQVLERRKEDGPAPRANSGQRRQHREPHSFLRGLRVAPRDDRRVSRRAGDGQDASPCHGPGKTVRRNRAAQA
jgi:segregation and condensation protein A